MPAKQFWDSNLWIYLFVESKNPADIQKQEKIKTMLLEIPDIAISVQVLNEVMNVLLSKYQYQTDEAEKILSYLTKISFVLPLTTRLSAKALHVKTRYRFGWFDSLIVAAALETKSSILYSEDLQHNQVIEDALTIVNPFAPGE